MKRIKLFLLFALPLTSWAQVTSRAKDTTLVFKGEKVALNTFALLPPAPNIQWKTATRNFTTVQTFACITNLNSTESIRFFINGEEQPLEQNDFLTKHESCPNGYYFHRLVELTSVPTTLRLDARNVGGAETAYFVENASKAKP
ncbi:hypothetical protein [Larkinella terrae]|uniref:Uncharacterized protein n=1 Tax=Larkinella terrae TaxID=2025311 RepID=A0A7K0EUA6_9BACT|nr:hypothetical protein [Larkinella terrae]MRS65339.1 hypothetical protein [Larkinella terrae]